MVTHNPRAEMPEDAKLIPLAEAEDHGYWGQSPDQADRGDYTVEGALKAEDEARKAHQKRRQEWAKAASTAEAKEEPAKKPSSRHAAGKESG